MLYALGFVGFGVWPLAFVAWRRSGGRSRRPAPSAAPRAALLGFVFGWVAYAGGFPWLWRLVDVFLGGDARLGAALWLAYAVWFALGFAL